MSRSRVECSGSGSDKNKDANRSGNVATFIGWGIKSNVGLKSFIIHKTKQSYNNTYFKNDHVIGNDTRERWSMSLSRRCDNNDRYPFSPV